MQPQVMETIGVSLFGNNYIEFIDTHFIKTPAGTPMPPPRTGFNFNFDERHLEAFRTAVGEKAEGFLESLDFVRRSVGSSEHQKWRNIFASALFLGNLGELSNGPAPTGCSYSPSELLNELMRESDELQRRLH